MNPFASPPEGWDLTGVPSIRQMLDDLDTPSECPTPWEATFLDSIARQFADHGSLSPKQIATLVKIHKRIG